MRLSTKPISSGVEVIIEDLSQHPSCSHGPTLLFSRSTKRFYACSACRNRKDCSFYMLEEDWVRLKERDEINHHIIESNIIPYNVEKMKHAPRSVRSYCHDCSILYKTSEEKEKHIDHDITLNISSQLLANPSKLLKPLEDNKKEAQYLFSEKTIELIISVFIKNNLRNIVCLGVPRIHEYILNNKQLEKNMNSILLDIDARRYGFHKRSEFCHYNIFNNHFFKGEKEEVIFNKFVQRNNGRNVCIVMDPPFGGRIEPLGDTLKRISIKHSTLNNSSEVTGLLPTMLVLPYFMEPQINNHICELKMCDYQVTYENHNSFRMKKSHQPSPVRIFTNISLNTFVLPDKEGYKYCSICNKWVSDWNQHCSKCKSCTSKNGKPYIHCDICERCVKSSWEHCPLCKRCCLKEHQCKNIIINQACFFCKEVGHKKTECPKSNSTSNKKTSKKRKLSELTDIIGSDAEEHSYNKSECKKQKKNKKKERRSRIRINLQQYKLSNQL